jgi:hypothetical protein
MYNGRKMSRDIVQFVAFRDYQHGDPAVLAAKVLAEIPGQFTSYMRMKHIQPRVAPQYSFDNVTVTQAHTTGYQQQPPPQQQGIPQQQAPFSPTSVVYKI